MLLIYKIVPEKLQAYVLKKQAEWIQIFKMYKICVRKLAFYILFCYKINERVVYKKIREEEKNERITHAGIGNQKKYFC